MIKNWIDKGYITSAQWRLLEIAFYSGLFYLLWALMDGEIISPRGLIVAIWTPIFAYVKKKNRDITKLK